MKTATYFLDAVKAKHGLTSDYQLSKYFGWNQQRISKIRSGATFDDEAAAQVAAALDLEAGYVMACMAAQRAKTDQVRKTWEKAARVLGGTAAAVLVFSCALALAPVAIVPEASAASQPVYYVKFSVILFALIVTAHLLRVRRSEHE